MTTQSGFIGGVNSLDLWAASLPHIDSDVSDSDDYLPSDKCCPYPPIMNNRQEIDDVPAHPVPQSIPTDPENEKQELAPPEGILIQMSVLSDGLQHGDDLNLVNRW